MVGTCVPPLSAKMGTHKRFPLEENSTERLAVQVKKGKSPTLWVTRIFAERFCTEDFPVEQKNQNAGCALKLANTMEIVFSEKCESMNGREGGMFMK